MQSPSFGNLNSLVDIDEFQWIYKDTPGNNGDCTTLTTWQVESEALYIFTPLKQQSW